MFIEFRVCTAKARLIRSSELRQDVELERRMWLFT